MACVYTGLAVLVLLNGHFLLFLFFCTSFFVHTKIKATPNFTLHDCLIKVGNYLALDNVSVNVYSRLLLIICGITKKNELQTNGHIHFMINSISTKWVFKHTPIIYIKKENNIKRRKQ